MTSTQAHWWLNSGVMIMFIRKLCLNTEQRLTDNRLVFEVG